MTDDEQLNRWRLDGTRIRVIRDAMPSNDIKGIVVAWNEESVLVRKGNRKVVKLPRSYRYQPVDEPRPD